MGRGYPKEARGAAFTTLAPRVDAVAIPGQRQTFYRVGRLSGKIHDGYSVTLRGPVVLPFKLLSELGLV